MQSESLRCRTLASQVPSLPLPVSISTGIVPVPSLVAVYALDTRNHGDSPHTEDMDYLLMATDLELFCKERGLQGAAILGHSMGGRAAMTFALTRPSMVERLVVVDVAPTFMPTTVDVEVLTYLRAMRETLKHISPEMSSPAARKEAEKHLGSVVQEYGVLQFLLTNLRKGEHSYEWQFNAETLESCMRNITQMPELKGLTYDGRVLFICGRNSIYVREEHHGPIRERFPKADIVYVENAGHWVQADKPAEFLELVTNFLKDDDT
ncbi:hypothetical protein HPB47_004958 [Ixodes persulcatus]|uniref:Uncharacterized protein n=1 Tax=Ixodes persulcatus TaxID=34615 RepID=A0AC60PE94_IXOPE|nr:hypothetical protein HPB47_004958 [Ixodes persulcatus]